MTRSDKFELLRDVALLLKKHGPAAFTELADFLRDQASVDELISILGTLGAVRQSVGSRRPSGKTEPQRLRGIVERLLAGIHANDPEKAKLLSTFHDALSAKQVLPTMRDIRGFVGARGLRPITASSRARAIPVLLQDLAKRSLEEIRVMLQEIRPAEGDRALEGWATVILGDRRS